MQAAVRRAAVTAVLCALAASAIAISTPPASAEPQARERPTALRQAAALDALDALTVKGRAPLTGYSRAAFGPAWADVDRNGCDTRNDILARDLVRLRMDGDCKVTGGVLAPEPYTGRVNVFT